MKENTAMNSIIIQSNSINIKVGVYLFKDGEYYVAYCPSLDLVGYSNTEVKAKDDFEFILQDWLEEQVHNNTLSHDLKSHGWKIDKEGGKEPSVGIIPDRKEIDRIINLPEYTKTSMSARLQCC